MSVVGQRSAEEFYSQCLANARTLDHASHRLEDSGDTFGAMATAWGADVFITQAVLWERILVASPSPLRQYFRAAEGLFGELRAIPTLTDHQPTCMDVLVAARLGLLGACDPSLRGSIQAAWADQSYLAQAPAPTAEQIEDLVRERFEGLPAAEFVDKRRGEAVAAMGEAQAMRVRGETVAAIQTAYGADFLSLEAYLVESALAAGDPALLSVVIRWELAAASVSQVPGLPEGFVAAVARIREALAAGLSESDASRLAATFVPVV
jgi:hypothetical protein